MLNPTNRFKKMIARLLGERGANWSDGQTSAWSWSRKKLSTKSVDGEAALSLSGAQFVLHLGVKKQYVLASPLSSEGDHNISICVSSITLHTSERTLLTHFLGIH